MFNLGIFEWIIIAILVVILSAEIWLPLLLRKKYPQKMWVAILLAIIFIPFGQLYLEGGTLWIIGLGFLTYLSRTIQNGSFLYFLALLASPTIMYFRMKNVTAQVSSSSIAPNDDYHEKIKSIIEERNEQNQDLDNQDDE